VPLFIASKSLDLLSITIKMSVDTITTISPTTNKPVLTRTTPTGPEIQHLLSTSVDAFTTFRHAQPLSKRQLIVEKALEILIDRQDALAQELTEQMGRPIAYTAKEIATAKARSEYLLKISDEALADTEGEVENGFKRYIRREAVGPILIIFAWNVSSWRTDYVCASSDANLLF
jgi:acyl-CoA reductase-like NAD-dependent aldehyde dehydrogenase